MPQNNISLKNPHKELKLFFQRLSFIILFVLLGFIAIFFRLANLQILNLDRYQTLSNQNQFGLIPTEPRRGIIYDRNGVIVADDQPVYSLEIIPAKVKGLAETIANLSKILDITEDDKKSFYKAMEGKKRFEPIPLKMKLTESEIAKFYVNQWRFPGVRIAARFLRFYPLAETMVTPLGFMARINQKELEKLDETNYAATDEIGKVGLEKHFENVLHGSVGYQQVETDASGRIVRVIRNQAPTPGNAIYLTIDSQLEKTAQDAFGDTPGAAIAIDPRNGEILAMYSNPSYDPNIFVQGISSKAYKDLQDGPGRPLYNRAARGLYAPASTIKPYMALQGLRTNTITPDYSIFDPGYFVFGNHTYRDWWKGGHGVVSVQKAITVSCDPFFYNLAIKMGIRRIDDLLNDFGFGQATHIEIDEELSGLVPSPDWKSKTKKQKWFMGDTIVTGIGQGYLLATPLQLASAVSTIAMSGKRMQPHLLLKMITPENEVIATKPVKLNQVEVPEKVWKIVHKGMYDVVQIGTARIKFGNDTSYSVAAKTGTAQVFRSKVRYKSKDVVESLRDNSLFIAYAPVEDPKIAVAVVAEHSEIAAKIARHMMDQYFSKENHVKQ